MNPKIFWRAPNLCKEESMWLKKQVSRVTKKSCNVVSSKHPFVCSLNMSYIIKLEIVNFYLKLTQVAAILCLLFKIILSKRGGDDKTIFCWSVLKACFLIFRSCSEACSPLFGQLSGSPLKFASHAFRSTHTPLQGFYHK